MKNLLSSAPLLISAAAMATAAVVTVLNLSVITPQALSLGIGIATCAGLLAMLVRDLEPKRCC